jgi:D-alanyl-D-alanine carboxypeptidase
VPPGDGQEPQLVDLTEINPSVAFAAGEMISTTADLSRFADALLAGELVSPRSLAAMRQTVPTEQAGLRYGLGLVSIELTCGVTVWGHDGAIEGFVTDVTRADDGRRLVLSVNPYTQPAPPDVVADIYEVTYCDR